MVELTQVQVRVCLDKEELKVLVERLDNRAKLEERLVILELLKLVVMLENMEVEVAVVGMVVVEVERVDMHLLAEVVALHTQATLP
jgi:hypothetical protein